MSKLNYLRYLFYAEETFESPRGTTVETFVIRIPIAKQKKQISNVSSRASEVGICMFLQPVREGNEINFIVFFLRVRLVGCRVLHTLHK